MFLHVTAGQKAELRLWEQELPVGHGGPLGVGVDGAGSAATLAVSLKLYLTGLGGARTWP